MTKLPDKEYMVSLTNAAGTQFVSMKTLCNEAGLDYDEEVKRMKKEGLLKGEGRVITAKTLVQSIASQEDVAKWDEEQNKALIVDQKSKKAYKPSSPMFSGFCGSSGFSGVAMPNGQKTSWLAPWEFDSEPKPKKKAKKKTRIKKEPPPEEHIIGFDRWDFM